MLSLSVNGSELSFTGKTPQTQGSPDIGVGTLNAAGVYSQPAQYGDAGVATAAYSADGANWYFTDSNGIHTGTNDLLAGSDSTGSIKHYGANTYVFHATSNGGEIAALTPSSPTSTTNSVTYTPLPGLPDFASIDQDFCMVSSANNGIFDTLYESNGMVTGGEISKFALIDGTWTAEGSFSADLLGCGITAVNDPNGGVDLYLCGTFANGGPNGGRLSLLDEVKDSAPFDAAMSMSSEQTVYENNSIAFLGVSPAPISVPEPASLSLALAGVLTLLRRGRRNPRKG